MSPYYQDASCTLYLGDCRDVLPQLDVVDHAIFDPPFAKDVYLRASAPKTKVGSGTPARMGVGALKKLAAGDIGEMDVEFMRAFRDWAANARLRRWFIAFSDVESCHLWRETMTNPYRNADHVHDRAALRYVRTGAWVKPNAMPQMSGDRPAVGFEPCTIAHAHGPMRWNGGGKQAIWTHNIASGAARPKAHPCPKPLPLIRDIVMDFTDQGDVIFDPFAGSATTMRAAKLTGRRAIGVELNEEYAEEAAEWLERTELDERYLTTRTKRGKQAAFDMEQPA